MRRASEQALYKRVLEMELGEVLAATNVSDPGRVYLNFRRQLIKDRLQGCFVISRADEHELVFHRIRPAEPKTPKFWRLEV